MDTCIHLTGNERTFHPDQIIVSKTDLKGMITYANQVFLEIAGYEEAEILGANHNIIRHPAMPRCVFELLWNQIQAGQEIFAYVVNRAKNGDHYWVLAHVTPTFDSQGEIIGYHSNRRVPSREAVSKCQGLYEQLLEIEQAASQPSKGMAASRQALLDTLNQAKVAYDEFVFSI